MRILLITAALLFTTVPARALTPTAVTAKSIFATIVEKAKTRSTEFEFEQLTPLADAIGAQKRILLSRSSKIIESSAGIVCDLPWLLQNLKRLIAG